MSINVTVNGNPVISTKHGKMVACNQDAEFNLRRKIRLQQVRQQSKEIAAEVRNRVKQEKTKQLSNIEHLTEKDLRKFQERKLHTLQKHYEDCNREIGAAHKNAATEKDPTEVFNEISKKNDKNTLARLKIAVENKAKKDLQRQNELDQLEKQRKYTKELEKTRANLVVAINKQHSPSKVNRSSKKRKKKNDTNLNDTFNSDIENISSPILRKRSSSMKQKKNSPIKGDNKIEMKKYPKTVRKSPLQRNLLQHQKPKKSEEENCIFGHEVPSVCDEDYEGDEKLIEDDISPIKEKSKQKINVDHEIHSDYDENCNDGEKHLKNDVKSPRKEKSKQNIFFDSNVHSVCDINCNGDEKHLKNNIITPRKYKSTVDTECLQNENKCSVCFEKSESSQSYKEKSEIYPKPKDSSIKDDVKYDDDTCPCCSPSPHNRAIYYPVSPPTKCATHFSSSSSLSKELSKDEIKKLIDEHRPIESCRLTKYYKTTKISDRIRQRSDQPSQDSINVIPEHKYKSTNLCEAKKLQKKNIQIVDIPSVREKQTSAATDKPKEVSKLPYVPQTTLKSIATKLNVPQQTIKAKYYDHSNQFNKMYVPPTSVQKLDKECVDVDSSIESIENANFFKNMCTQEQRAKIRGNKALKRAHIQNDYKQLMEELPVLQRQERLAAMRNHNPEFHMTDERLHELERRRQNRIENIFEKYYHKSKSLETPIITIRPVQKPAPNEEMKLPFTALDVSEELQSFNIGQWKSENSSKTSKINGLKHTESNRKSGSNSGNKFQFIDSKPELSKDSSQKIDDESRQKCLAELLQRLNKQRELLLQEVQNLPPTSNLQKILHDDTLLTITDDSNNSMLKTKFVSASTSPVPSLGFKKSKTKKDVKKRHGSETSSDSTDEKKKRRQKPKEKKQKIAKSDECTQTSPNLIKKSAPKTSDKDKLVPKKDIPQEINTDDDKLCEIIIKMCDESKVKICTQPIESAPVETKYEEKLLAPQKQINNDISSSTSYLSPPIICPKSNDQNELSRSDYKDILYGKPKQTNIDTLPKRDHIKIHSISKQKNVKSHTPSKIINPQLLNYIKKLLSMSRKSIDDLTVSSVSEVSSPSPHIVESHHNNPFIQLQNVMNYYNLSFADIQNQLNHSSKSPSSATKSNKSQSNTDAIMEQVEGDTSPTSDDVDYSEILSKYQEVTKSCVDKISTLTLMIDKIRAEKERILSPISVDFNENSMTSYLELPPQKHLTNQKYDSTIQEMNSLSSKNNTTTSGDTNKSCSLTQEEIDRYFLEIGPPKKDRDSVDYSNNNQGEIRQTFIPMLKGIPKYNNDSVINQININPTINLNSKPRPPASLTQNVQRYNLNIDMIPHELSTIVELDTATSKNISEFRPKSPEDHIPIKDSDYTQTQQSKEDSSTTNSGFITISPEQDISRKEQHKSPRSKYTKTSNSDLQLLGIQPISSLSENTSSSSPENFEDILRTMGLGWAVSTLKKTQEALALSSSSSSDSSLRKHVSLNNTSISEISLKDVLNREFLKKLSSSSSSPNSPNLQELQDISNIVGETQNKDRSNTQRTSTPVQQSKSTDSKTNLFASVSDISSVKQHSDENMFLSIPDISLDTNRSLK